MDPAQQSNSNNMEKKNLQQRATQQSSKTYSSDQFNKDIHKKQSNGGRKQQSRLGGEGDGGSRRAGRGAWGRASNKSPRTKEKESQPVVGSLDSSHEDSDQFYFVDRTTPVGGRKSSNSQYDLSSSYQSWFERDLSQRSRPREDRGSQKKLKFLTVAKNLGRDKLWQARCQFVVNRSVEHSIKASKNLPVGYSSPVPPVEGAPIVQDSPDDKIEWKAVEEVILHMTQETHCPVCLYAPVAPQVTLCGHVYCYPCILHYLALSDQNARSCPICYENVEQDDLKSAVMVVHPDYVVGHTITMVLMKRKRESMLPEAFAPTSNSTMSRKITATKNKVEAIIEREMTALETQMCEDMDAPESCFIQQAMDLVRAKETAVQLFVECPEGVAEQSPDYHTKSPTRSYSSEASDEQHPTPSRRDFSRKDSTCSSGEESSCTGSFSSLSTLNTGIEELKLDDCDKEIEDSEVTTAQNFVEKKPEVLDFSLDTKASKSNCSGAKKKSVNTPTSTYYFYQAVDGSHVYLYSVNLSMLITEYGGVENCPHTISATILEKDYYVMSENQRNRLRYLRHLPLNCPFETVELNLEPPLVSTQNFQNYKQLLEKRQNSRKAKAVEEQKIERRNIALQEKALSGRLFKRIDSEAKSIQSNEMDSLSNDPRILDQHFPQMSKITNGPTSFANMVRVKAQRSSRQNGSSLWPELGKTPAPSGGISSPSTSGAWGAEGGAPVWGKKDDSCLDSQREETLEDYNAPDFRQAFSQGIDSLFQTSNVGKKKKGKKGKKK